MSRSIKRNSLMLAKRRSSAAGLADVTVRHVKIPHRRGEGLATSRPRRASPETRPRPAGILTPRLDGLSILVLEDHSDSRDMLRQMLEAMGAVVRLAADGWDGLRYLSAAPDVVLCDLLMPVMDGFEFVAAL